MKVIDDKNIWISYKINVSDSNSECDIVFESIEANSSHRVVLEDNKITDNIIDIKFYAYLSSATEEEVEELCTIEYNIMEDSYVTK